MDALEGVPMTVLTGKNYMQWKLRTKCILESKGLDQVVYGTSLPPKTEGDDKASDAIISNYKSKECRARMLLTYGLDEKHTAMILNCKTAREIWDRIELEYAHKEPVSLDALLSEFYTYKMQPNQEASEYVTHLENLAARMAQFQSPISEEAKMAKVMSGLLPEFSSLKRAWDLTPPAFKSMDLLLSNLRKEEQSLKTSGAIGGALLARDRFKNRRNDKDKKSLEERKRTSPCSYCEQLGHWWRDCPSRPSDYKPPRNQGRHNKGQRPSQGQLRSQGAAGPREKAMTAKFVDSDGDNAWYLDSGASAHMTSRRDWMDDYQPLQVHRPIIVGSGECLFTIGIGSVPVITIINGVEHRIRLHGVYYVPKISDNLFSISAAIATGNVEINFKGDKAYILCDGELTAMGVKADAKLYRLDVKVPMRANIARSERTLKEWHQVLGHADTRQIENMAKTGCVEGLKIVSEQRAPAEGCGDCQAGKGKAASHPESNRQRATQILERIHMDIVGPIKPASVSAMTYFLLLKDEFSSYMFVEFVSTKADVLYKLRKFVNEVTTMKQARIRYFRSDNGSEFTNQGVQELCDMEGIIPEFSCAYTPQQNGKSERANRTVIETARSILLASRLPLSLWAEAVASAVYVRNRTINTRSNGITPFELFHGHKPSAAHLMRFGEPVHILDRGRRESKFSSKTQEAFVVGYGPRVNTYRCLLTNMTDVKVTSDIVPATHRKARESVQEATVSTFLLGDQMELIQEAPSPAPGNDFPHQNMGNTAQITYSASSSPLESGTDHQPPSVAHVYESPRQSDGSPNMSSGSALQVERARNETFIVTQEATERDDNQDAVGRPIRYSDLQCLSLEQPEPQLQGEPAAISYCQPTVGNNATRHDAPMIPPPRVSSSAPSGASLAPRAALLTRQAARSAPQPSTQSAAQTGVVTRSQHAGAATRQRRAHVQATSTPAQRPPISLQRAATVNVTPNSRSLLNRFRPAINNFMERKSSKGQMKNLSAQLITAEPQSYDEAINSSESKQWSDAIKLELDALEQMNTWSVVKRPDNVHEITAKWIFKHKLRPDGQVERHKARLVARGFTQVPGLDYFEVFAPVVRMESIRLLFSMCAQLNLVYYQFDIATAFLNGSIQEEIYLKPPEGVDIRPGETLRLHRSLYGLKQSPRCWGERFREVAEQYGLRQTASDPCVFKRTGAWRLYLALYVDDGLVLAETQSDIERFISYLRKYFQVNEVSSSCFVGIEIQRLPDGSIFLHQTGYTRRMLDRYGMTDCKGVATPLPANHTLNKAETLEQPAIELDDYAAAIGSLLYCAMGTRPCYFSHQTLCKEKRIIIIL